LGNFFPLLRSEFVCARPTATYATQPSKFNSRRIPLIRLAILDLTSGNIADQFGKLDRVARALLVFDRHALIIAQPKRTRTADSRSPDFKLTHYQDSRPMARRERLC
jgi:hypothetical protein